MFISPIFLPLYPLTSRASSPLPVTHTATHSLPPLQPVTQYPSYDGDTDQETDRLLGQQRSDDPGFYDEKVSTTCFSVGRVIESVERQNLLKSKHKNY
ncbi:hypothetical protein E2C01_087366 [Portunus trituberculatus]|uniref:Uncharacterized protein n=1 Tax=Portunus trituberculatus TaxID=210409 RepID=A0A5B7JG00_PORTR|nr:hypothetical protein [Portunus trituberculatus]